MIMTLEKQIMASTATQFDYNTSTAASRSVPGSRRNSNDGGKSNNMTTTIPTIIRDSSIDFFMKPPPLPPLPPRSFSIDVGSMHNHNNDLQQNYTSAGLFFDDDDDDHTASTYRYVHSSRFNNNNNSYLFDNALDFDMCKNSTTKSTAEPPLRTSKSWTEFLESPTTTTATTCTNNLYYPPALIQQGPLDTDVQAAFYGQPTAAARRFSSGWPSPTTTTANMINKRNETSQFPYTRQVKYNQQQQHQQQQQGNSRLSASYSYSDLQNNNNNPSYYNHHRANNIYYSQKVEACQQFRQYGYCSLKEQQQCPYSHIPTTNPNPTNNVFMSGIHHHHHQDPTSLMTYSTSATTTTTSSNTSTTTTTMSTPPPSKALDSFCDHIISKPPSPLYDCNNMNAHNLLKSSSSIFNIDTSFSQQQQRRASTALLIDTNNNILLSTATNEANKFTGAQIEDFQGKLYDLCKDQNGCRFLQLKLEESSTYVTLIYNEIYIYFVDLMTDPFGNYLCQKLLEKCNDDQRTAIVEVIAPELLKICLSMHGTRAVQKLIEFLSTKRQIQAIIKALQPNVVALIKDLNGNHVIQKCLHKLSAEHNQFIYDTVSEFCIEVASHKHGCCVYQRCIDHAVQSQKDQLVQVITRNALPLVQDPFGNYVVQYVLGLGDAIYSDLLIRRFIEPVRELSVQKFSSNVIEKCIRVAENNTRRALIAGIIQHPNMERFLRDSYANYVIQTCLDFAEEDQKQKFIDCIKPLLSSIRNTPYGKRIYSKIHRDSSAATQQHLARSSSVPNTSNTFSNSKQATTSDIINGMNSLHFSARKAATTVGSELYL